MRMIIWGIFMLSLNLYASGGKGNGGDVVVCKKGGKTTYETLDIYEERQLTGKEVELTVNKEFTRRNSAYWKRYTMNGFKTSYIDYALAMIESLKSLKDWRYETYKSRIYNFLKNSQVEHGTDLPDINDSEHLYFPKDCRIKQIAIQWKTPQNGKRYRLDGDLWDKLDDKNKAALVIHEIVFEEAINIGHRNAIVTRKITRDWLTGKLQKVYSRLSYEGMLFSQIDLNSKPSFDELEDELKNTKYIYRAHEYSIHLYYKYKWIGFVKELVKREIRTLPYVILDVIFENLNFAAIDDAKNELHSLFQGFDTDGKIVFIKNITKRAVSGAWYEPQDLYKRIPFINDYQSFIFKMVLQNKLPYSSFALINNLSDESKRLVEEKALSYEESMNFVEALSMTGKIFNKVRFSQKLTSKVQKIAMKRTLAKSNINISYDRLDTINLLKLLFSGENFSHESLVFTKKFYSYFIKKQDWFYMSLMTDAIMESKSRNEMDFVHFINSISGLLVRSLELTPKRPANPFYDLKTNLLSKIAKTLKGVDEVSEELDDFLIYHIDNASVIGFFSQKRTINNEIQNLVSKYIRNLFDGRLYEIENSYYKVLTKSVYLTDFTQSVGAFYLRNSRIDLDLIGWLKVFIDRELNDEAIHAVKYIYQTTNNKKIKELAERVLNQ